jgi:hypothetical protein
MRQFAATRVRLTQARAKVVRLIVLLAAGGCYTYVPIPSASVQPDEEVRVRVTEAAAARLVGEFGAYTAQFEGTLAPAPVEDSLSLSVQIGRAYRGMALENARQTLYIAPAEVVEVRRRRLSTARTALAVTGVIAGFVLLTTSVDQVFDPNPGPDNPPPPPPGLRFLRFRINPGPP